MFNSSNPALRQGAFGKPQTWDDFAGAAAKPRVMTLNGTIACSGILLGICAGTALAGWMWIQSNPAVALPVMFGGGILGLILSLVIVFKPQASPYMAPVYAVCEGGFVAGASVVYAAWAAGGKAGAVAGTQIVFEAALLTFGIAAAMLIAYATRLIKPTRKVIGGIVAATGGVILFAIASWIISFFNPSLITSMWSGPLGIAIAGAIVVVAAMNLIVDFFIIETGVQRGAPKYMEWYGAFALLVTLVWLYVSLLRLLAIINRR